MINNINYLKKVFIQDNLGKILFWCVMCNIAPVFGNIFKNSYIDNVLKLTSYIIPIFLILVFIVINKIKFSKKSLFMLVLFIMSQILSNFIFVPNPSYVIFSTYTNILNASLLFFIYYISFSNFKLSKINVMDFCKRYLWFSFFTCVFNVIYNFNDLVNILSLSNGYSHYFMSFFGNRNTYGLFLFSAIMVYYLLKTYKFNCRYFRFFFLFIIINLIITFSRTSIIATVIFILIIFILQNKNNFNQIINKKSLYCLISTALIVCCIIFFNNSILKYILNVFIRPTHIFAGRDQIWTFSLNLWLNNNLLFGTGNIFYAFELNNYLNNFSCHNIFLTILNRGGVVLFGIYSFVFYAVFLKVKNNINLLRWYIAAFTAFLFIGMFESALPFFNTIYAETVLGVLLITIPISLHNSGGE